MPSSKLFCFTGGSTLGFLFPPSSASTGKTFKNEGVSETDWQNRLSERLTRAGYTASIEIRPAGCAAASRSSTSSRRP